MVALNNIRSNFEQMDEIQFQRWASLLEEKTGMHLPKGAQ